MIPFPSPEEDSSLDSAEISAQIEAIRPALRGYILSILPHPDAVEDVVQETCLFLWERRADFQAGTNFKAWAFQTIRYQMLNHRRRLVSQGWLVFDDDLIERVAPGFEFEPDELEERHIALRRCLQRLRPQDREILHHRYATRAPLQDYAEKTNRSAGTLKAILFNLRAALKKCIERQLQSSTPPKG